MTDSYVNHTDRLCFFIFEVLPMLAKGLISIRGLFSLLPGTLSQFMLQNIPQLIFYDNARWWHFIKDPKYFIQMSPAEWKTFNQFFGEKKLYKKRGRGGISTVLFGSMMTSVWLLFSPLLLFFITGCQSKRRFPSLKTSILFQALFPVEFVPYLKPQ